MKTSTFLSSLLFIFLAHQIGLAQTGITINDVPDYLELDCNDSPINYEIQDVYDWIDNFILSATVNNECNDPSNSYTWTNDFIGQALNTCYESLEITFTVTNECGESFDIIGIASIVDDIAPVLDPPSISEHTLFCYPNNPFPQGLTELYNNNYYFTLEEDNCGFGVELTNTGLPISCTDYNTSTTVHFSAQDGCFNNSENHLVTFNIIGLKANFSSTNVSELEDVSQVQVCLQLSSTPDEEITVEVTNTEGTATANIDYIEVPEVQNLVFPINSSDAQCFTISLLEDTDVEANETIGFQITNVGPVDRVLIGGDDAIDVVILDNDDNDNDNIENSIDNCPDNFNPYQEDFDNDSIGDVCDDNTTISEISEFQDYIYINKLYSGVIVKDVENKCWVIVVQPDGALNTVNVNCPED